MKKRGVGRRVMVALLIVALLLRNIKRLGHRMPSTSSRYMLLIAHPDDESMFFAPTLLSIRGSLEILCLSNGGCNGLGRRREEELRNVCSYLGCRMTMLDYKDNGDWSAGAIAAHLSLIHMLRPFDVLITFDGNGVSGHKNHISCHEGARLFLREKKMAGLALDSKDLLRKYTVDFSSSSIAHSVSFRDYFKPIRMMLFHRSQLVWFRWLYIFFSNFMSYNDYKVMN
jgi:N-acetylglucosaminylphosphatidylinositol deacetylase